MPTAKKPKSANAVTLPCGRKFPVGRVKTKEEASDFVGRLRAYCDKEGLNRSESREKLLAVIGKQVRHFTALQLLKEAQSDHPDLGISTVYRNLPIFVAAKILRESLSDENGQIVYEVESGHHHDHIVCLDCQAIIEFHEEEIEALQERVLSKLRFKEVRHRHILYAHCKELDKK